MRFRVFGVPIEIQASFWVMTVLLAFDRLSQPQLLVEWALVVLVSIIVHELGHATAASTFGCTPRIALHAMGGTCSYVPAVAGWRRAVVAFSGPLAGFVLGAAAFATVLRWPGETPLVRILQSDLLFVNVGWGVLNLLPIVPLDGGHLLEALAGRRFAQVASWVTAAAVAIAALTLHNGYSGMLVWILVWIVLNNVGRARTAGRVKITLPVEDPRPAEIRRLEDKTAAIPDQGAALVRAGRASDAWALLEPAWRSGVPGTEGPLVEALIAMQGVDDAQRFLRKTPRIGADGWRALATALMNANRLEEAAAAHAEAARRDAGGPPAGAA